VLADRISRSTLSLPKVRPYWSGHENNPETQESTGGARPDDARRVVDHPVKARGHEQRSTQKAQKELKPAPLFLVALVLTHARNYAPGPG
jgi:hypothetical protein